MDCSSCYEAFVHIVDSMVNQHIKWLRRRGNWRGVPRSRPSTTCSPRTSGVRTTTASRTRTPASSTTSSTRTPRSYGSSAAGRQHPSLGGGPRPAQPRLRQRRRRGQAALLRLALHGTRPAPTAPVGAGIWEWAGSVNGDREPDVVLACAGDVPTQEILAASDLLRRHLPSSPSASSTSSTSPGCCPATNTRTEWPTSSTTAFSPPTSR